MHDVYDNLLRDAGRLVRPVVPGWMLTMDYRESQVNLEHDEDGVVTRAWIG